MKTKITKLLCLVLAFFFAAQLANSQTTLSFDFASATYSGATPYNYAISGIGNYYKNSTGSSQMTLGAVTSCNGFTQSPGMGNGTFTFYTPNALSKITVYGAGTGNGRTFSTMTSATTLGGTATSVSATGSGTINNSVCGNIVITPSANISAGSYLTITFTGGNINITNIVLQLVCTTPTIGSNPSTGTQSICAGANGTALTGGATGTGTITYQWYRNTTNSNSGGTAVGSTNTGSSTSYTPNVSTAGTYYYYYTASTGTGCTATSSVSGAITVNAAPTPTFPAAPTGTVAVNTAQTYTTQSGQSNYVWTFSGTTGVDYTLTGGTSTDNTSTVTWLTAGSKTVTVNYTSSGCTGAAAASSTVTVSASLFYNVVGSDVTNVNNWGTNTDGTGTHPSDFITAGQTFNLFNAGATMSASWDVQGAGTKVIVGNGITFDATQAFTTTSSAVVDVAANSTLKLSSTTLPTFGTLANGSTVDYAGTGQTVTATSYSNLSISGSTSTLTGTTNVAGTFTPGTASAGTSTVVLNGTSTSQVIPAFAYNNLTVAGIDGKSTSGTLSVAGTLNVTNSFTVAVGSTLSYAAATITSATGKVLTVNGTFDFTTNGYALSAGSGSMTVNAGGTLKASGYTGNNGSTATFAFTNINLTSGIGASGSTLLITGSGIPRLPASVLGNVTYDVTTGVGGVFLNSGATTISGNLNILNTGTTGGNIANSSGGGTNRNLSVGGNLNISGGTYNVAGNLYTGTTDAVSVTGNINVTGGTLNASGSTSSGSLGIINVAGNISHTAGSIGNLAGASGVFNFNGTSAQTIATTGFSNTINVTVNNAAGVTLSNNDLSIGGTLTLTNGKLKTNGYQVIMVGIASTIAGASSSSYVATVDASGTPVTTGGLTIQNIGTGGRTGTISFPIGTNTSYNPATVNNSNAAVAFTARVNATPYAGTLVDSTVARTWNIQPASGSPSAVIGLQWNGSSEEGLLFNRNSASIAHYNGSATDFYSEGGAASGTNPYSLNSGTTNFTSFGDFGLIPGIVTPAVEPTTQASSVVITPSTTNMTINWTVGSGTNSIVVVKQASAVTAAPIDGTTYNDGAAVMSSGSNLGSGNYVVYTGTGNSVTVTGLTTGTAYYVAVYTFNGSNGTQNYLTTTPATGSTTTLTSTYYYVGGVGGTNSTNNSWNSANQWSSTLGGSPVAAFTPTANDVFIFDGNNIGSGTVGDSVTILTINSNTIVGKIIVQNNARVNINSAGTRTMTIGNSGYSANTVALSVAAGSKLYFGGSQNTVTLATNSSANVSGWLTIGANSNSQLLTGASGSTVTVNNGGTIEANMSSASILPFGSGTATTVFFATGSTFKGTKTGDPFGGTTNGVASFATGSLCWIAGGNSASISMSGRTFGNFKLIFHLPQLLVHQGFQ